MVAASLLFFCVYSVCHWSTLPCIYGHISLLSPIRFSFNLTHCSIKVFIELHWLAWAGLGYIFLCIFWGGFYEKLGDAAHIIKIYTDQPKGALYIICSLIHVSYAITETPMIWFSTILDDIFHQSIIAFKITLLVPKGNHNYSLKKRQIQSFDPLLFGPSKDTVY